MVWGIFSPRLTVGVRACQDGLGHFFPTFAGGVRACQDSSGHFFFQVCLFEGGGGRKLFGQCPYKTNSFQKGASLTGTTLICLPFGREIHIMPHIARSLTKTGSNMTAVL